MVATRAAAAAVATPPLPSSSPRKKTPHPDALDAAAAPAAGVLPPRNPEGDAAAARRLYSPPKTDALPLLAAALAIGCWGAAMAHALFSVRLPPCLSLGAPPSSANKGGSSPWWDVALTFAAVEFASTALFITAHDAMHGAVCRKRRWLNDLVGRLCLSLYAWFDYGLLYEKHWEVSSSSLIFGALPRPPRSLSRQAGATTGKSARRRALTPPPPKPKTKNNPKTQHHNHTGRVGGDPDFHGGDPGFFKWFARFMLTYSRPGQYARIVAWVFFLQALGAPYGNVVLYVAAAPITAAVRLFYFGTYLPHLPPAKGEEKEQGGEGKGGKKNKAGPPTSLSPPLTNKKSLRRLVFGPERDGRAEMAWQLSHSTSAPPLLAFLECLCFGYHWEHHRFPYAPWFDLPKVRALAAQHGLRARCVDRYLKEAAAREVRDQQQEGRQGQKGGAAVA